MREIRHFINASLFVALKLYTPAAHAMDVPDAPKTHASTVKSNFTNACELYNQGLDSHKQGDSKTAQAFLAKALLVTTNEPDHQLLRLRIALLHDLGLLYFFEKNYQQAEAYWQEAVASGQPSPKVYNNLGKLYFSIKKNYQAGCNYFYKAAERGSEEGIKNLRMIKAHITKKFDESIKLCRQSKPIEPITPLEPTIELQESRILPLAKPIDKEEKAPDKALKISLKTLPRPLEPLIETFEQIQLNDIPVTTKNFDQPKKLCGQSKPIEPITPLPDPLEPLIETFEQIKLDVVPTSSSGVSIEFHNHTKSKYIKKKPKSHKKKKQITVKEEEWRCACTLEDKGTNKNWRTHFTDDGTMLVAYINHKIHLIDSSTGKIKIIIPKETKEMVRAVKVGPDKKIYLFFNRTIQIFDGTDLSLSPAKITLSEGYTRGVLAGCNFSPDASLLVTCYNSVQVGPSLILWDAHKGTMLKNIGLRIRQKNNLERLRQLCFSKDGKSVIFLSHINLLNIWEVKNERFEQIFLYSKQTQLPLECYTNHDSTLGAVRVDDAIEMIDLKKCKSLRRLEGHSGYVYYADFSPDGKFLATAGSDTKIKIWDVASGMCLQTLVEHTSGVKSVKFSPDGRKFLSEADSGYGDTIKIWSLEQKIDSSVKQKTDGVVKPLTAFMDINKDLLISVYTEFIIVCDLAGKNIKHKITLPEIAISKVQIDPARNRIIAAGQNKIIYFFNISTAELITSFEVPVSISALYFDDKTDRLFSGHTDGSIRIWDCKSNNCLKLIHSQNQQVTALCYNAINNLIIAGLHDGAICIYDPMTTKQIQRLKEQTDTIWNIAIDPKSLNFVSMSNDKLNKKWEFDAAAKMYKPSQDAQVNENAYLDIDFAQTMVNTASKILSL